MSRRTQHFNLNTVGKGGSLKDDGYKPLGADRDTIDLLVFSLFKHHHTGESATSEAPTLPLSLQLDQAAGSLAAGSTYYYKYTLVDPDGLESMASPESFITTPAPVAEPGSPTLTLSPTGGTLLPGAYNYVLSAYRQANTLETRALAFVPMQVPGPSSTNKITLTLPTLPAGAHGFNVYRRKPGSTGYQWIGAVDLNVATPPTTFVDTGLPDDCARSLPNTNRTNSQNNVTISLPGATPVVPLGYTWKIYRTLVTSAYNNSLLHWVVEETAESSGVITPNYVDLGYATTIGSPPSGDLVITQPDPIELEDAAEVQGVLPPANIVFREVVEFRKAGTLAVAVDLGTWRCPFEEAYIIEVIVSLGKGYAPVTTDVIVDVNKYDSALATPAWATVFSTQANRPRVPVGTFIGQAKVPDVRELVRGDFLSYDIDQAGGSATPNDKDLLVQIVLYYKDTTASTVVFP